MAAVHNKKMKNDLKKKLVLLVSACAVVMLLVRADSYFIFVQVERIMIPPTSRSAALIMAIPIPPYYAADSRWEVEWEGVARMILSSTSPSSGGNSISRVGVLNFNSSEVARWRTTLPAADVRAVLLAPASDAITCRKGKGKSWSRDVRRLHLQLSAAKLALQTNNSMVLILSEADFLPLPNLFLASTSSHAMATPVPACSGAERHGQQRLALQLGRDCAGAVQLHLRPAHVGHPPHLLLQRRRPGLPERGVHVVAPPAAPRQPAQVRAGSSAAPPHGFPTIPATRRSGALPWHQALDVLPRLRLQLGRAGHAALRQRRGGGRCTTSPRHRFCALPARQVAALERRRQEAAENVHWNTTITDPGPAFALIVVGWVHVKQGDGHAQHRLLQSCPHLIPRENIHTTLHQWLPSCSLLLGSSRSFLSSSIRLAPCWHPPAITTTLSRWCS
jgi:hypothetical protein